jgi:hypothetical protein
MSNKITIKRSSQAGKVPQPGDLEYGEFALNYTDGNLFFKSNANVITNLASTQFVSVTGNVSGGNIVTLGTVSAAGNITGNHFVGNGSQLTGITATAAPAGNINEVQINGGGFTSASANFTFDGSTVSVVGNISGNYFLGNGSQLTGIQTVSSELINGSKTFGLNSDGTVDMPSTAVFFDAADEYITANVHVLDQFDKTQYQTAKYLVQAATAAEVHSTELLLTHNSTATFMTQYATLISGNALITLDSAIVNSNVVLSVTTLNPNTKVDFFRISLLATTVVPSCGIEGDLELQSGTVDLNEGFCVEDLNEPSLSCGIEGDLELQSGTVNLGEGFCVEDLNTN